VGTSQSSAISPTDGGWIVLRSAVSVAEATDFHSRSNVVETFLRSVTSAASPTSAV
jgi:hypothetical protein